MERPQVLKSRVFAFAMCLLSLCACSDRNFDAPVRSPEEARASARHAWDSVYSKTKSETFSPQNIRQFEPYTATLRDGVWHVHGTLPSNFHGVVPEATIRESDGRIDVSGVSKP